MVLNILLLALVMARVGALIIPTDLPDIFHNDYGLAEAMTHDYSLVESILHESARWSEANSKVDESEVAIAIKHESEAVGTSDNEIDPSAVLGSEMILQKRERANDDQRGALLAAEEAAGSVLQRQCKMRQCEGLNEDRGHLVELRDGCDCNVDSEEDITSQEREAHILYEQDIPHHLFAYGDAADEKEQQRPPGEVIQPNIHSHSLACRTPNTQQPSIADWWVVGGPQFLKTYVDAYSTKKFTSEYGLFGGLAHCYGLSPIDNASYSEGCVELRKSLRTDDSQQASFALTALKNLLTLSDIVLESLDEGFSQAAALIDSLPYTNRWWRKTPRERKARLATEIVVSSFRDTVLSELPWMTTEVWKEDTEKMHKEAVQSQEGAKISNADPDSRSHSLNKWDQLFGTTIDIKFLEEARHSAGYDPAKGADNEAVMAAAAESVEYAAKMREIILSPEFEDAAESTWKAFSSFAMAVGEKSKLKPKAVEALKDVSVKDFFGATALLGQKSLSDTISGVFNGTEQLENGDVYELLRFGNLFVTDLGRLRRVWNVFPSLLAKRLYHTALNEALLADTTYITCTVIGKKAPPQFGTYVPGSACLHDRSGPQEMKACLENEDVCYLYRWKEPKYHWPLSWIKAHNDKPAGIEEWGVSPHFTNITGIILSSVGTALNGLKDFRLQQDDTPLPSNRSSSIIDIANAEVPGTFRLPVCYSDYSWNSPMLVKRKKNHWWELPCLIGDPYCYDNTPPCYCGPWGSQTLSVWDHLGHIPVSVDKGNRLRKQCASKIKKKIKNPLEAYVAYCRINVRRVFGWTAENRVNGLWVWDGKDDYCDDVIDIIEKRGYRTVDEIDPEVRYALYCKILGDSARCQMYDELWNNLKEQVALTLAGDMEATQKVEEYESEFARLVLQDDDDEATEVLRKG